MALVIGLYLYDAVLLLHLNEGILRPRGRAPWSREREAWAVGFGSQRFQMRGKELRLPNPLLLHRPVFRLTWALEGAPVDKTRSLTQWTAQGRAFRGAAPMLWGIALALFVLLPLGLFTRLGETMLLLTLALVYLNLLALLAWLWFSRKRLDVSGRQFASISFEYLTCAPFALNLVQRLSLRTQVAEDLVHAARRLQQAKDWDATRAALLARLDEEIESEIEGSERRQRMQAHRDALAREGA